MSLCSTFRNKHVFVFIFMDENCNTYENSKVHECKCDKVILDSDLSKDTKEINIENCKQIVSMVLSGLY